MTIRLQPIMAGNAIRAFVTRPAGMLKTRVLRKIADDFVGETDPDAYLVHEGTAHVVLDVAGLVNGTDYFYRIWHWDGATWTDGGVADAAPAASYTDSSVDALTLLRDRLIAGLAVEVAAGRLTHPNGRIAVRTAPPEDKAEVLPLVTLQLSADAPAERALGEDLYGAEDESEGWLASVRLEVIGWSLNPDEHIALRLALKRIVLANLPVFDDAGLVRVEFSQQDTEDFQTFTVPMYMTNGSFTCLAPASVGGGDYVTIADIPVTAIPIHP